MFKYLLITSIFFLACSHHSKNSIVGKWRPTDITTNDMNKEDKKSYLDNARIEFTRDGRFITSFYNVKDTGTYNFDESKAILVTTTPHGATDTVNVKWDGNNMNIVMKEGKIVLKRQ